jgi:ABC-type iron transport system FetAB permease component
VLFIVCQSLVTVLLFTIMKIYILHWLKLPKHKNLRWQGGPSIYQKFVLRNAVQFLRSSRKSFLRERSVSFLLKSRSEGNAELTAKNKR